MMARRKITITSTQLSSLLAEPATPLPSVREKHLTDEDFAAYASGALPTSDVRQLDDHLVTCVECCEELERLMDAAREWGAIDVPARLRALQLIPPAPRTPLQQPSVVKRVTALVSTSASSVIAAAVRHRRFLPFGLTSRSFGIPMSFAAGVAVTLIAGWFTAGTLWQRITIIPVYVPTPTPRELAKASGPPTTRPLPSTDLRVARTTVSSVQDGSTPPRVMPALIAFPLVPITRSVRVSPDSPESLNRLTVAHKNVVSLPSGTFLVRLELPFEADDYNHFAVVVKTAEGKEVWPDRKEPGEGNIRPTMQHGINTLMLDVPSGVLSPGEYYVTISGITRDGRTELINGCSFQVQRTDGRVEP
jgi:hypothetical protein